MSWTISVLSRTKNILSEQKDKAIDKTFVPVNPNFVSDKVAWQKDEAQDKIKIVQDKIFVHGSKVIY